MLFFFTKFTIGTLFNRNTIAISPFSMVGKPSAKPRIILLFPNTNLIGIPLPVIITIKKMISAPAAWADYQNKQE